MSESDDTDELLLMSSKINHHMLEDNFVPYYKIVDKLITQVSKLKSRLTNIENPSDVSIGSFDTLFNMQSSDSSNTCRRCYSFESLPQNADNYRNTLPQSFSTQSTPQKPRSKLMLRSFPNSPKYSEDLKHFKKPFHRGGLSREGEVLSENADTVQPLAEEKNIIKEIDNFLSNVRPSLKSNVAKNLDFDKLSDDYSEKHNRVTVDVHQILKEMDEQELKIKSMCEKKLTPRETINTANPSENEQLLDTTKWKKGIETLSITSTDSSLTDKSTVLYQPIAKKDRVVRESDDKKIITDKTLNFISQNSNKMKPEEFNQKYVQDPSLLDMQRIMPENYSASSNFMKKSSLSPHFDVHSNAKDVLSMHRKLLDETHSPEFPNYYDSSKKLSRQVSDSHLGSMNLYNLWGAGNVETEKHPDKCIQKLQEEKLRRTHCEELIQQLQNKILEQQEKLAVAIQVDEAKDTAIIKFHDAWERATVQFRLVVTERDKLEKELEALLAQNKKTAQDCEERIEFHRKETNQALNMAHEHQSKSEALEKKNKELLAEIESLKCTRQELENRVKTEEDKNKQLSEILANKEIELNESKNILLHAKKEVSQCQAAVEMCQKDFATMKSEYESIEQELKVERQNAIHLRDENKILQDDLEVMRNKEKELLEGQKDVQEKMDNTKKELRNFYQGQVELLVQTKLKEFQKQLDDAEQKMKKELEKKELEMAKAAAMHIQQINDKYSLEINLLEQKSREESQLQQVKIAQLEQRLHELQNKYDRHQMKKSDLMKQLQKVMEAQWTEALRIINNGRSPAPHDDSSSTIDQLQTLHSKSYQNLEALLNEEHEEKIKAQHHLPNGNDIVHHQHQLDRNHQKRDRLTRKHVPPSRNTNAKSHDEATNLQKYINLLLHKPPGNPPEGRDTSSPKFFNEFPTTDRPVWQYGDMSHCTKSDFQEKDLRKEETKRKAWK